MTLVSPENAAERPGWKVSPLGRITRPVKIRPARPLPEIQETKVPKAKNTTTVDGGKKKKKRLKDPDTRARRRAIDMTKWGSTHLKGIFLDLEVPVATKRVEPESVPLGDESDSDSGSEIIDTEVAAAPKPPAEVVSGHTPSVVFSTLTSTQNRISEPTQPLSSPTSSQSISRLDANADIHQEKAQALTLLNTLFGGDDVEDWIGQESPGSDIDLDELTKGDVMLVEEDANFEVVPRSVPAKKPSQQPQRYAETSEGEDGGEAELEEEMEVEVPLEAATQKDSALKSTQPTTLKHLFAPREEEGNHLGISPPTSPIFTDLFHFFLSRILFARTLRR